LLLVEPNRQLLYYYLLYILYTAPIANYYHFWYYYFNYTYYWLYRCPTTYYIIYIFTCWSKRAEFIILLYNIFFIIYIELPFLSLILSIHIYAHHPHTSTHRFCSATLFNSCWVLYTLYTLYTGRSMCVAVTRSS
jgi:hypothetical protein